MHKHQCGLWVGANVIEYILTPIAQRPQGCGYEWEHDESNDQLVQAIFHNTRKEILP